MFRYVILVALLAITATHVKAQNTVGIEACLSGIASPFDANVVGCTTTPCDVVQGTSAEMHLSFVAPNAVVSLWATVQATALGITGAYTLPPNIAEVCPNLQGNSCPMVAGEDATHVFYFPVGNQYPPIPVTVELTVSDQNDSPVFCTRVAIHVRLS